MNVSILNSFAMLALFEGPSGEVLVGFSGDVGAVQEGKEGRERNMS